MKQPRHLYHIRIPLPEWERLRKLSYERNESIQSLMDGIINLGLNIVESDQSRYRESNSNE